MDNQKIIMILLCVIVALLVVGIVMVSSFGKESSNIEFNNESLSVGDSLTVKLTDSKGNPIANETVNIKLKDKEDKITIDKNIATDSSGNAQFKLEETGNYSVELKFNGNGKYSSSSSAGNLNVGKATTESVSQEQTSTTTHTSKYSSDGTIYPEYGPGVDARGITREYAIANNWHYIPQTIDGQDAGLYVPYDAAAGCYHT